MTTAKAKILEVLLREPEQPHYGYELMRSTKVKSGSLYPILEQIESAGWLTSQWEAIDERQAGRPPRRWYRLTAEGRGVAQAALDEFVREAANRSTISLEPALGT